MITILTDDEKWALAQFCKRIDYETIKCFAANSLEVDNMNSAIIKIRDFLAEMGIAPR